jgi:hypothetical protein
MLLWCYIIYYDRKVMYVLCTISGLKGLSLEYCNKLLLFESKISGSAPIIFYAKGGEGGS